MDALNDYCEAHSSQPDAVLNAIYRGIALHTANPHMASTPYQGLLLEMLASMQRPLLAVEVGSFAGFGAVCIARGLQAGGVLHVVEANEECEPLIRENLQQANLGDSVVVHIGNAMEVIPVLPDGIDFAFVDADKVNYDHYYDMLLPKMRKGGMMIFDNMLWYGRVMSEAPTDLRCDRSTRTLQQLNDRITHDPRVQNILLPIRDGLMLCRVV